MSECKHENSSYHYYMEQICECGYKRVMDEDEADQIIMDSFVKRMTYIKDEVGNALIKRAQKAETDLQAEKVRADKAEARVAELVGALEIALYDLTTSHNLLATDRPDLLMANNEEGGIGLGDITWMIDNSRVIDVVKQALAKAKDGESNG